MITARYCPATLLHTIDCIRAPPILLKTVMSKQWRFGKYRQIGIDSVKINPSLVIGNDERRKCGIKKDILLCLKRYQNWQRHFTGKRISSKMTFPNNDNRWKGIVQKSWQDTTTQFCVCKDSKNIYFVKALDYQFLWICLLLFFLSLWIVIQKNYRKL